MSEGSLSKEGSRREKRELDPKRDSTTTLQTETTKKQKSFFQFFSVFLQEMIMSATIDSCPCGVERNSILEKFRTSKFDKVTIKDELIPVELILVELHTSPPSVIF
jgi:hypothetical protein